MKTLTRNPDDRCLGGVCSGIADYTGIDATVVRLVVVVCTLLGAGSLVVGYAVAWILIPRRQVVVTAWAPPASSSAPAPPPAAATAPAPAPPSA